MRREVELGTDESRSSGLKFTITRKGIEVFGWYDTYVGIEGFLFSWDQIDQAREEVNKKGLR